MKGARHLSVLSARLAGPTVTASATSAQAAVSFAAIHEDLSQRFLHDRLNSTNRNLVFRPRRAKELSSRKHSIVVDGEPLKPLEYRGVPGGGSLFRLIDQASTSEEYQQTKSILFHYGRYARANLKPQHLAQFLRKSAQLGHLEDAYRTLASHYKLFGKRRQLVGDVVDHELLRLRAIAAQSENASADSAAQNINRALTRLSEEYVQSNKLSVSALAAAGYASCAAKASGKSREVLTARARFHAAEAQNALDSAPEPSKTDTASVCLPFVVDLTLASRAAPTFAQLGAAPLDATKLTSVISAWSTAVSTKVDSLIAGTLAGYMTERGKKGETEAEAGAEAKDEGRTE